MSKLKSLILDVLIEQTHDQVSIEYLVDYLKNKPLDFNNQPTRSTLSNYIDSYDMEKMFDIFGDFPNAEDITQYANYAEEVFNTIPEDMQNEFMDGFNTNGFDDSILATDDLFDPTYKTMEFKQFMPNATLVRFMNDDKFMYVAENGFKGMAIDNIAVLGVTRFFESEYNADVGFLFAYESDSKEAIAQANTTEAGQSYGENFVLFTAPAVEVYHNKDFENQIVFCTSDVQLSSMIFAKGSGDNTYTVYQEMTEVMTGSYDEIIKEFG